LFDRDKNIRSSANQDRLAVLFVVTMFAVKIEEMVFLPNL
jgi:hypothetical protein